MMMTLVVVRKSMPSEAFVSICCRPDPTSLQAINQGGWLKLARRPIVLHIIIRVFECLHLLQCDDLDYVHIMMEGLRPSRLHKGEIL